MSKIDIEVAFIFSKREDIRDVVRQAFKSNGLDTSNIHNVTSESNMLNAMAKSEFAYVIVDWEMGPETVINILGDNCKSFVIESHPTFLLAAKEDEKIIHTAREFFVNYCAIGDITTDTIRDQVKGLVNDYRRLSPVRQVLLNVERAKKSGDMEKSHEMLLKLNAKSDQNPRVVVELAESYIHQEKWKDAEALLRPHLNLDPPYARIKHLYAKCRLRDHDYNSAIASLKGAQLISPYNTERLLEMGDVFLDLDRIDEANDTFDEILKLAPGSKKAKLGKSKGMLLAGELNEALTILRECGSNKDLSSVFNTAAIIAIKQEKFEVGFGLYQKAIKLLSSQKNLLARIIYNMGIGFVKTGDQDKGLACFLKSSQLDPGFENAHHNASILQKQKTATDPLELADFQTVDFEESIVHSSEVVGIKNTGQSAKENSKTSSIEDSLSGDLDLDSIFDEVENF